jgi:hypothetical protein
MKQIDSDWLVDQMARIIDSPINVLTVITTCVDREASLSYLQAVKSHLASQGKPDQAALTNEIAADKNDLLRVG